MTRRPITAFDGRSRTYVVERIMLGTTSLEEGIFNVRILRVSSRRHAARGLERSIHTLSRWGERQWRRIFAPTWLRVGDLEFTYGEPGDLWIRNMGAWRVDQRAIARDRVSEAWAGEREPLDIRAQVVELPVLAEVER